MNKYSSRTYNDLSQYPIFPWLLLEYENIENIDKSPKYLRNLKYPISVQNEQDRKKCIDNFIKEYENLEEEYKSKDENEEKSLFNIYIYIFLSYEIKSIWKRYGGISQLSQ